MTERRRYSSRIIRRPTFVKASEDPEQTAGNEFMMPGLSKMDSFLPPILDDTGAEIEEGPTMSKGM